MADNDDQLAMSPNDVTINLSSCPSHSGYLQFASEDNSIQTSNATGNTKSECMSTSNDTRYGYLAVLDESNNRITDECCHSFANVDSDYLVVVLDNEASDCARNTSQTDSQLNENQRISEINDDNASSVEPNSTYMEVDDGSRNQETSSVYNEPDVYEEIDALPPSNEIESLSSIDDTAGNPLRQPQTKSR